MQSLKFTFLVNLAKKEAFMESSVFLRLHLLVSKQHQSTTKAGIIAIAGSDSCGLQDLDQIPGENKGKDDLGNVPNYSLFSSLKNLHIKEKWGNRKERCLDKG